MAYPVMATGKEWFAPNVSTVKRSTITKVDFVKDYTPSGSETDVWDASAAKDGSVMVYVNGTEVIVSAEGSEKIQTNADSSYVFGVVSEDYFLNLEQINGLNLLDTSQTTTMRGMFQCCVKVKELDVGGFDMRNVDSVMNMFMSLTSKYDPMSIEHIYGTEKWKFEKTVDLKGFVRGCESLKGINLAGWHVVASDMTATFDECENIQELDLSGIDNTNATGDGALYGLLRLERLKISNAYKFETGRPNDPSSEYIEGADGKWHTIHGDSFTSADLPGNINLTYYATAEAAEADLAKLKQTFVLVDGYTAVGVADAIREKTGTYGDLTPSEWASAIRNI